MANSNHLANAIRFLAADAVQQANSGHPGMPMGMADIAEVLWRDFLKHNPKNPKWFNRDRFILSNGHGSMLIYALLHLTGYDLSIEDLKQFRQVHSKTPGHPEYGMTPGIEVTTGPLGQGLANAVGMAIAEKQLANEFNQEDGAVIDHYIYAFCGDGCLMEGISHEACSFAGTLGLGKLIVFWDDNGISIDGKVAGWFSENTAARFKAYHWQVIENVDGHNREAIKKAIIEAKSNTTQPTLICCKTVIGQGAPNVAGTEKVHGSPLGVAEIKAAREHLGWSYEPFVIPEDIYLAWDAKEKGQKLEADWEALLQSYAKTHPELASELKRRSQGHLPTNWPELKEQLFAKAKEQTKPVATRKASKNCLDILVPKMAELLGGSADLTASNLTKANGATRYLYYGVREFGMAAMMNGIALHGGYIPFGGTFLTFVDYMKNAVRLSAMSKERVIYVFTHDSIGLGEDGPTHQPIEQLTSLRLIPGLSVWRPADQFETAIAWQVAIENRNKPTCLILSRQDLPQVSHSHTVQELQKGAYALNSIDKPHAIIIATGSEVSLALAISEKCKEAGKEVRVVSMPSVDVFEEQDTAYKRTLLPEAIPTFVIEAGRGEAWYKYVRGKGKVFGIERFGESAPYQEVYEAMGLTEAQIMPEILKNLQ